MGAPADGLSSSSRAHGRRVTNTYPPTPNTTGTIINIPNTVLIIVFSIPHAPSRARIASMSKGCLRMFLVRIGRCLVGAPSMLTRQWSPTARLARNVLN